MREKLDLEVQLKDKENYINHMKDQVGDDVISPTSPTVNFNVFIREERGILFVLFFFLKNPIDDLTASDANRPRFTLEELRHVLWERNDLKTKLLEVEEELRFFKEL
jgi:hypothetical protein